MSIKGRMERVTTIGSIFMNSSVVKQAVLDLDENKKPAKLTAVLVDKSEAEEIKEIFALNLGCGYGCPSLGVDIDQENGAVVITRNQVYDHEAFDFLVEVLAT